MDVRYLANIRKIIISQKGNKDNLIKLLKESKNTANAVSKLGGMEKFMSNILYIFIENMVLLAMELMEEDKVNE